MQWSIQIWLASGLVFLLAGWVKGVLGMGLPTVAMGLLSLAMPPAQAAAVLVVPSLVTNIWQLLAGPAIGPLVRRLWGMMAAVAAATVVSAGVLVGSAVGLAAGMLGAALIAYAILGLTGVKIAVRPAHEGWLSPIVGATTGLVTGATGVFVLPAVPYLQAFGLEKDEFVQALGLSFTVSTLALAAALLRMDALHASAAWMSLASLVPAIGGMVAGQAFRRRLGGPAFRRAFFAGLFALGVWLVLRQIA